MAKSAGAQPLATNPATNAAPMLPPPTTANRYVVMRQGYVSLPGPTGAFAGSRFSPCPVEVPGEWRVGEVGPLTRCALRRRAAARRAQVNLLAKASRMSAGNACSV